ncbi:hypothetical protein V4S38_05630 [Enterococcus cecorum]
MAERKIIQVEEKVPFKLLLPLSLQHMFAMFGASVLVPFIFGINPSNRFIYEWFRNTIIYFYY